MIKSKVFRIESNMYYAMPFDNPSRVIRSTLRGRFKNDFKIKRDKLYVTDICVVGDLVDILMNEDGTGVIQKVYYRENHLSRKAPRVKGVSFRGERMEQVIASNLDRLYVITSFNRPEFNNKVLDRFLVAGESSRIEVFIVMNKIDIAEEHDLEWIEFYKRLGYTVIPTSIKTGIGIDDLKESLQGKTGLFWGQSGVGKSSLLNKLFPSLSITTGDVSGSTNKGTHTTASVWMFDVGDDTYIVDTPGVREIDPYGITKQDLSHYMREFVPLLNQCKFNGCTHYHEPGCVIYDAVENETISELRYDSYLRMLETIEEGMLY